MARFFFYKWKVFFVTPLKERKRDKISYSVSQNTKYNLNKFDSRTDFNRLS